MTPAFRKVALAAASLGLLVSVVVALRDGGDGGAGATPSSSAPPDAATAEQPPPRRSSTVTIGVRVVGGQPVGGIRRLRVTQGRQVVLVTTADVSDRVHLHGYDLTAGVAAGAPARIRFRAARTGRFEMELEDAAVRIGELSITP